MIWLLAPLIAGGGFLAWKHGHDKGHAKGAAKAVAKKLTPDEAMSAAAHAPDRPAAIIILRQAGFPATSATWDRLQAQRKKAGLPPFA